MKKLFLPLALCASLATTALHAQVSVDFEHYAYIADESVHRISHPDLRPALTWIVQAPPGRAGSATVARRGNRKALKIESGGGGSVSVRLLDLHRHVTLNDNLVSLSFDFAVDAGDDGAAASHIRIGGAPFGAASPSWLGLRLTGGTLGIYYDTGTTNAHLALSANYANLVKTKGDDITVKVVINTTTNTYSSLTFTGSKSSLDATPAVVGMNLPFAGQPNPDLTSHLIIHAVGTDNTKHYFSNIQIGAIPGNLP